MQFLVVNYRFISPFVFPPKRNYFARHHLLHAETNVRFDTQSEEIYNV